MILNKAKERILRGEAAVGVIAGLGSPEATAVLAGGGYDFVLVDNQHGAWDDSSSLAAFRTISLGGAIPMARVRIGDYTSIGRLLDRGALGIAVPMVNTPADARAAVYATRYPPAGGRSWAPPLATHYGADYLKWANREILLLVQIETAQAVRNAAEILAVEGVDGCWVGPADLGLSLAADLDTAEGRKAHQEAIMGVLDACRRTGKIPGIHAPTVGEARDWLDRGFLFVTAGGDADLLADGARGALRALGR